MKSYPNVMNEHETIQRALDGASLSRYGDGELRLAIGGAAVSQIADRDLQDQLQIILRGPCQSLVCIPRLNAGGHKDWPMKYAVERYNRLYGDQEYGSSFVTRPDNAPACANGPYMASVRKLWIGKDVTLVLGVDHGSLTEKELFDAASVTTIYGPRRDAFSYIRDIEDRILAAKPKGPVIMCLGATATVLAERLARKGLHALDLGHIGRFMKRYEKVPVNGAGHKQSIPGNPDEVQGRSSPPQG